VVHQRPGDPVRGRDERPRIRAGERDLPRDRVELLAAGVSGDLAYTVELEHTSVSIDGAPVEPYTLRVTQVYRREDGEWKVVHRHGDQIPFDQPQGLPGEAATA
jgi:ketosteroid isomerase-like protein